MSAAGTADVVRITAVMSGEATETFSREEFEEARAEGKLADLFDCWRAGIEPDWAFLGPDGEELEV